MVGSPCAVTIVSANVMIVVAFHYTYEGMIYLHCSKPDDDNMESKQHCTARTETNKLRDMLRHADRRVYYPCNGDFFSCMQR